MTIKTVDLKKAIPNNEIIPVNKVSVGHWVEDRLEANGYNINRGAGVDLPDYNVEVKTRCTKSKSAHTVCRMTTDDIINTSYDQSAVKNKIQQQYRLEYDNDGKIITNRVFDFSEGWIQKLIKESYEAGRKEISQGMKGKNNTKTYGVGLFQRDKNKEQWQYRISEAGMKHITKLARQKSFKQLFDY